MGLYQGALNKQEVVAIQKELQGFFMLPVNEPIAKLALQCHKPTPCLITSGYPMRSLPLLL
jgi:hypothetical protein